MTSLLECYLFVTMFVQMKIDNHYSSKIEIISKNHFSEDFFVQLAKKMKGERSEGCVDDFSVGTSFIISSLSHICLLCFFLFFFFFALFLFFILTTVGVSLREIILPSQCIQSC